MKTVELFAGIGGFRIAADNCKLETIWANDIDEKAVTVYKDNYGDESIIKGDINELIDNIPDHDLLTGGFPCQPFSKAGKKLGIEDYRGTLFESIVKVIERKKPQFFILENVNSLLYMNNGNNFKTILNALIEQGYKVEWCVFNAIDFGLPQHRLRVIIVGSKGQNATDSYFFNLFNKRKIEEETLSTLSNEKCWSKLIDHKGKFKTWGMAFNGKYVSENFKMSHKGKYKKIKSILESNPDSCFDFTEDTKKRIENSDYVNKYHNGVQILYNQSGGARMGYSIFGTEGVAPTLTASTSRHYERYKVGDSYRRLTNKEYARLQGFPDDYCNSVSVYNQYKLYGNAVPPQMIEFVMKKVINKDYTKITSEIVTLLDF